MSRNLKDSPWMGRARAFGGLVSFVTVALITACGPAKKEESFQPPPELGPKWGFIDHNGKFVIKPQFRRVLPFSEGLAAADLSSRWGFIDNTGKFVIERQFEDVTQFKKGFAAAKIFGGKWELIDKNGAALTPATFEAIGECGEANKPLEPNTIIYCSFRDKTNKWGFITTNGEIKVDARYDSVGPFSEGLAAVSKLGKWGFIDPAGKEVVDLKFDEAKPFHDRVAECRFGSDFVIIDNIGTMSVSDMLNSREYFHDGLGLSLKRGKYGFMNQKGKTVVKRRFTYAEDYSEGLALVGVANARLGFIDTKGAFAIPPVFDGATSFGNKLAGVKIDPRLVAEDGTISASAIEEAIKYDPHAGVASKTDDKEAKEKEEKEQAADKDKAKSTSKVETKGAAGESAKEPAKDSEKNTESKSKEAPKDSSKEPAK